MRKVVNPDAKGKRKSEMLTTSHFIQWKATDSERDGNKVPRSIGTSAFNNEQDHRGTYWAEACYEAVPHISQAAQPCWERRMVGKYFAGVMGLKYLFCYQFWNHRGHARIILGSSKHMYLGKNAIAITESSTRYT